MVARFSPNSEFMRRALADVRGPWPGVEGGPFGACVVRRREVLAVGHSTVIQDRDPTCHAEMNAIRLAARKLESYDLSGCEIYSTNEPCPMCFAAIHWARLDRLIYGTSIGEAARLGFNEMPIGNLQMQAMSRSPVAVYAGFLLEECRELLEEWARLPGRQVY